LNLIEHANVGGEPALMKARARRFGAGFVLLALTGGLAVSTPAAAQDSSVEILVSGVIPERCGFARLAPAQRSIVPDLETAQTLSFSMPLDCNTPFAVGVTAERGALTNVTSRPDGSGYAFSKIYGVRMMLDTSAGAVQSARCQSDEIVVGGSCVFASDQPGRGLDSGGGIAAPGGITLTIDWPDQTGLTQRLAAGEYSDTITVVVGARA
jgi:hypothetical protein